MIVFRFAIVVALVLLFVDESWCAAAKCKTVSSTAGSGGCLCSNGGCRTSFGAIQMYLYGSIVAGYQESPGKVVGFCQSTPTGYSFLANTVNSVEPYPGSCAFSTKFFANFNVFFA